MHNSCKTYINKSVKIGKMGSYVQFKKDHFSYKRTRIIIQQHGDENETIYDARMLVTDPERFSLAIW